MCMSHAKTPPAKSIYPNDLCSSNWTPVRCCAEYNISPEINSWKTTRNLFTHTKKYSFGLIVYHLVRSSSRMISFFPISNASLIVFPCQAILCTWFESDILFLHDSPEWKVSATRWLTVLIGPENFTFSRYQIDCHWRTSCFTNENGAFQLSCVNCQDSWNHFLLESF